MNLTEQLALRTPLLWVTTDEPARVIDHIIAAEKDRAIYRMDALDGFVTWDRDRTRWVKVLVDIYNEQTKAFDLVPTNSITMAMDHAIKHQGLFIVDHGHQFKGFTMTFTSLLLKYRAAFYANDATKMTAQFVLLSYEDTVPDEFRKVAGHVIYTLPDSNEITSIVEHIIAASGIDAQLSEVARAAAGMSEADLVATSLISLREHGTIDAAWVADRKLEELKRTGLLEVRKPVLDLSMLGGLDQAKQLLEDMAWAWRNPEDAEQFEVEPIRRVLLVGVPGTGKSLVCEAAAAALGLDLAKGGVSSTLSKWVGESEKNMRLLWRLLEAMAPIVLFIDEFGRDMSGSGLANDAGTTDRVHGEFLTGLQELQWNIFLMAAANKIGQLPPEMTRADRFDKVMFVGFPTESERREIFRIHLGARHRDYDVDKLAREARLYTGAEIKAAIKEVRQRVGARQQRRTTTDDILSYLPQMRNRIWEIKRKDVLDMYARARGEWDWASSEQQAACDDVLRELSNPVMFRIPTVKEQTPRAETPFGGVPRWGERRE